MKTPEEYKALVAMLQKETDCYPDDCEYCSSEGKCKCQRIGQACEAIEELLPYYKNYREAAAVVEKYCCVDRPHVVPEAIRAKEATT